MFLTVETNTLLKQNYYYKFSLKGVKEILIRKHLFKTFLLNVNKKRKKNLY